MIHIVTSKANRSEIQKSHEIYNDLCPCIFICRYTTASYLCIKQLYIRVIGHRPRFGSSNISFLICRCDCYAVGFCKYTSRKVRGRHVEMGFGFPTPPRRCYVAFINYQSYSKPAVRFSGGHQTFLASTRIIRAIARFRLVLSRVNNVRIVVRCLCAFDTSRWTFHVNLL